MNNPLIVDLPHQLGRDEARRRIDTNVDKLERHIPGGAEVSSRWDGDTMRLDIGAMGQTIAAALDVGEAKVTVRIDLPGMLGFFKGPIEGMLRQKGGDLLLEDKRD